MDDLASVAHASAPSTPTKALTSELSEPLGPGTPVRELLVTPRGQARRFSAASPSRRASAVAAIEEPAMKKPRVHGPPLPPRLNALQKPWPRLLRCGSAICFGIAGLHATLLATGAAGELSASERALAACFWLCWLVTLLAAVKFLRSDPRDPGGEKAEVRCRECHMPVRPTSKHCYLCKECIVGFDHHCPWLNMCVGSQNYRWYFTLISGALGVVAAFDCQLAMSGVRLVAGEHRLAGAFFLLSHALGWPLLYTVGELWLLHCHLIRRGITTYEYWKRHLPTAPSARRLSRETPLQAREVASRVSSAGSDSMRQASFKFLSGANSLPRPRLSSRAFGALVERTPPSCVRPRRLASPCGTGTQGQGYQASVGWSCTTPRSAECDSPAAPRSGGTVGYHPSAGGSCRTPRPAECATFDSPAASRGRDVFDAICAESPCGAYRRSSQPGASTLKITPEHPRRRPPSFGGM